ncbi:GTP cyclohydrolase II RibA [Candidatus Deianiraea vastatrix]|uniref:3,4-dihydroxy-2-butanone 4-phosphate synthase n=1 Tax=Candidatus Deianiraea vastatrix TaxID=2163644 RepID=A0A5B8XE03_9RICK|nr:GTP cyclohydrolase II RibA [Candidatus Deianiraea vastatrix]QED23538.1 Riboflavin biosynthesis protein RibBA [Candidatus Deianiraea vastatrix]
MSNNIELALHEIKNNKMIIIANNANESDIPAIFCPANFIDVGKIDFCKKYSSGELYLLISQAFLTKFDEKSRCSILNNGLVSYKNKSSNDVYCDIKDAVVDFNADKASIKASQTDILKLPDVQNSCLEIVQFAGFEGAAVICELMDENGKMLRGDGLMEFAKKHGICVVSTDEIKRYKIANVPFIQRTASTNLPTDFGTMQMHVYQNPITKIEHIVMMSNSENRFTKGQKPLIRVHSECITSEVFFSKKCDCKQQLSNSMKKVIESGCGAVIYLRGQEGRGIGITNKIRAYSLQEEGFNTIDANKKLGLPVDARDFTDAVSILYDLQVEKFNLYTGNPNKGKFLNEYGFSFDIISPQVELNEHNNRYLHDKVEKMGHGLVFGN